MQSNTIIIGAGITGLSAAYYLEKSGDKGLITILESSLNAGGKIATTYEDGFVVEHAPDSFITTKPYLLDMIRELGLSKEIIYPATSKFFILKNSELMNVPPGLTFMVPTDKDAFSKSDMFSEEGKLRALNEENIPAKILADGDDESFGEFVERRFGKEMLDNYAEPLFAGIYSTPSYELSMRAAFPQFREMEQKYGSITKAIKERQKETEENKKSDANKNMQRSPFVSLKGGMQTLTDALLKQLEKTNIITGCKVSSIEKHGDIYRIYCGDKTYDASRIIITLPSHAASEILGEISLGLVEELASFSSNSSRILTLAFRKEDCELPDATGYVIARGEDTMLSASTWSSKKWNHRAPETHHLIRCFFSKPEIMNLSKDELILIAAEELSKLIPITGNPVKSWLNSYPNLLPQYKVGHLQKLDRIKALLEEYPGIHLLGAYYDGIGMPDCVKQAKEVVG